MPEKYIRAFSAGTFAAGSSEPSIGTSGLTVHPWEDAYLDSSRTGSDHTLTITLVAGGTVLYIINGRGGLTAFPGSAVSKIASDASDSSLQWVKVPSGFKLSTQNASVQAWQAGTWTVQTKPADSAGNLKAVFANGAAAPASGWVMIMAAVTDGNGVTLTDGTNSFPMAVPGTILKTTTASIYTMYQFPVFAGVTYTLSGTTLKILGSELVYQ